MNLILYQHLNDYWVFQIYEFDLLSLKRILTVPAFFLTFKFNLFKHYIIFCYSTFSPGRMTF